MSRFSIRNPYFIVVVCLIVAVIGLTSVARMPVDLFPTINIPQVVVATFYSGMPPEQIETDITGRFERFFTLGAGIDHMESRSLPGTSIIKVFFQPGTDADSDVNEISNLAMADLRRLPPGTLPPIVQKFDASSLPVCLITLRGEGLTETQLRDLGQFTIRNQLASVAGASVPPPFGGKYRQIMVYVDPEKLQAYDMSPMDVVRAVNNANLILPSGDVRIGPYDYTIFTNSQFRNIPDINRIPVKTSGRSMVTVGDIGHAEDANQIQNNVVRVGGQPSAYLPVMKQGGDTNTIAVVDGVRRVVNQLLDVPERLRADVVFDQSLFVKRAIDTLVHEGAVGLALTGVLVLVFLGSFRATVGVFLSIPLSVLAAFIMLYAGGSSINTMILAGFALVFSRLIDNAVIVLENIFRHLELGEAPALAAERGGGEVSMAVLAATLTSAVVFFPVMFLYGVSRFLFSALALAVVLSLVASYFVALTVVPLFCARFMHAPAHHHHHPEHPEQDSGAEAGVVGSVPDDELPRPRTRQMGAAGPSAMERFNRAFSHRFERLLAWYETRVRRSLQRPSLVVAGGLGVFVASLALYPLLGVALFPRTDAGQFVINMKSPSGTRIEVSSQDVARVESIVRRIVEPRDLALVVANIGVQPGFSSIYTSNAGPHTATVQVALREDHQTGSYEYMERVRHAIESELPHLSAFFNSGGMVDAILNQGLPAPIDVQLSGSNIEAVHRAASDLAAGIRGVPGVSDVFIPQDVDYPSLRLDVDREQAAQLGLNQREVVNNVITALTSNQMIAPSYWVDPKSGNDYLLTVQYPENRIRSLLDLRGIPLHGERLTHPTPLDSVTRVTPIYSPTEIDHYQIRRVIDIYVNPATEDLGRVAAGINDVLKRTTLPAGMKADVRGMVEGMRASFTSFALGLLLALVLLYLILVAQFRSFTDPVLILLAVPTGLAGVLAALFLTKTSVNVQSLMGVLMMVGMVVSNSILIVEFTHRLEEQGLGLRDAVVTSCRIRLRPILMTSLATVFGLIPMALSLGTGSEAYAPLARAIIGGLVMSVALTVFVVPAAYVMVYRRQGRPVMKISILCLWCAVAAAPRADAQTSTARPTIRLTLKDAERQAARSHPQIRSSEYAALAAGEAVREARSARFPTAFGSFTGAGAQDGTRIAAGGLNNPTILDRFAVGVGVSQLLTDFGRTSDLVASSRFVADSREKDVEWRRADVLLQVDRAYFNALRAQAVRRVAEETVAARQLVADQIDALAGGHLKSGLDVSFAKVNLGEAQLLLLQARSDVEAAYAELSGALGTSQPVVYELADEPLPAAPDEDGGALVARAVRDRPDVAAQRLVERASMKFADAERSLWLPSIAFVGAAGLAPYHQIGLNERYSAAGINVTVPLSNGNLYAARRAEAAFRFQAQNQALRDLENRVTRDVTVAWLETRTAYERMGLTTQLLAQASDALELATARYDLGLNSIVELSQAQLNKTRAQIEQTASRYQYQLRVAALRFQIGDLR